MAHDSPDGVRELALCAGACPARRSLAERPVTNIRNTKGPHWRGWLKPQNRCVVPFTSFCEYARPSRKALQLQRPLPDGTLRIVAPGEKDDHVAEP
jgi:putative SOS response-associated peptidase YedK